MTTSSIRPRACEILSLDFNPLPTLHSELKVSFPFSFPRQRTPSTQILTSIYRARNLSISRNGSSLFLTVCQKALGDPDQAPIRIPLFSPSSPLIGHTCRSQQIERGGAFQQPARPSNLGRKAICRACLRRPVGY